MTDVRSLARAERAEFAQLLDGLTTQQWSMASLCDGWTVRDVAAHTLAYLGCSRTVLAVDMIRRRGNVDRLNAAGLAGCAGYAPEQLIDLMHRGVEPSGAGALYGGRVALIECLIHQQDIRRPLGLLRSIPVERLRVSLRYARFNPVVGALRRTRGIRLVATDLDWSAGSGPEVRGPGEALLLAMTGRDAAADELAGDGLALLCG